MHAHNEKLNHQNSLTQQHWPANSLATNSASSAKPLLHASGQYQYHGLASSSMNNMHHQP